MKQLLIGGFVILPCVTEGDFSRLPMDGWLGGDRCVDGELIPQEPVPGGSPNIVWPLNHPEFWVVLDDTNRIVSSTPLLDPLPGIEIIDTESWNAEWQFCVDQDVNKLVGFSV